MRRARAATVAVGCCVLAACASGKPVLPYPDAASIDARSPEEGRLWNEADRFDGALAKMGVLYDDADTRAYLQGIMDRLYPEFEGRIRVAVVRDPSLNAFALPNGSVYVHVGILARLDSEAQIASVLAHEGAHFVARHALRQRRNVKHASAFALGTLMVGIPFFGDLAAKSSIFGYSRDLEREADEIGFEHLVTAGYAPEEAVRAFEHLLDEVTALKVKQPYFYSTHPRLTERIESFTGMAAQTGAHGGRVGADEYLARTRALRVASLEDDLKVGRYGSVILVLEGAEHPERYPPHAAYYLGEAYRLRGQEGDADKALAAYRTAAAAAPGFAPVYMALGTEYLKAGRDEEARAALATFLRLAPDAPDAPYARRYLEDLSPGPDAP